MYQVNEEGPRNISPKEVKQEVAYYQKETRRRAAVSYKGPTPIFMKKMMSQITGHFSKETPTQGQHKKNNKPSPGTPSPSTQHQNKHAFIYAHPHVIVHIGARLFMPSKE